MQCEPRAAVLTRGAPAFLGTAGVPAPRFMTGWKRDLLTVLIGAHILWIAIRFYGGLSAALSALRGIQQERRRLQGGRAISSYVRVDGRYFLLPGVPGWPSPAFRKFMETELNRIRPHGSGRHGVQNVILSVTGRCPLDCEHCCAWGERKNGDQLSTRQLKRIVRTLQSSGTALIQLSGGEPVCRIDDVIELVGSTDPGIEFWMLTSGHGLSFSRAMRLKEAGVTGVAISLDSWREADHDSFRGSADAFAWARESARACGRAGLVVCMTLCVSRDFATRENLWSYLRLVKSWGGHFVRILEPSAVGRYADQDVELGQEQLAVLADFHRSANAQSREGFPIVVCPSMRQRTVECLGAGNRSVYVDSGGDVHACPFCLKSFGNALLEPIDDMLTTMRAEGCHRPAPQTAS